MLSLQRCEEILMSSCKGSIRIICVHDTQVLSSATALGHACLVETAVCRRYSWKWCIRRQECVEHRFSEGWQIAARLAGFPQRLKIGCGKSPYLIFRALALKIKTLIPAKSFQQSVNPRGNTSIGGMAEAMPPMLLAFHDPFACSKEVPAD
jgi:hypothetical protein